MIQDLLRDIAKCDADIKHIQDQRASLVRQLDAVQDKAGIVLNRFRSGDYIVNSFGRLWWVNEGRLLTRVSPCDHTGLEELVSMGVIEHAVTTRTLVG